MSEEDDTCPLCIEEIDITDRYFKPCPCGYRVCRFCWTNLIEQYDPQCPACRRPYSVVDAKYQLVPPEELEKYRAEKKKRIREKRERSAKEQTSKEHTLKQNRSPISLRVVQKNSIYITGLPPAISNIDILKSKDILGQFGKIARIKHSAKGNPYNPLFIELPSTGIYVFFFKKEDAARAIEELDGCHWGSNVVRAVYATTKCCTYYLKKQQCRTSNCVYLHRQGSDLDSTHKEELSKSQLREKINKPISSVFPILDDTGYLNQKLPFITSSPQKPPITKNTISSTIDNISEIEQTSANKKQLPQEEISSVDKTTCPDNLVVASEKKRTPIASASRYAQSATSHTKQQKIFKIVKAPNKQRVQSVTPTSEDQIGKINNFPRNMKTFNSPKPLTQSKSSREDSLSSSSIHASPVFQSNSENQPAQSVSSSGIAPSTFTHKFGAQEIDSEHDAFQSMVGDDASVIDREKTLLNDNIDDSSVHNTMNTHHRNLQQVVEPSDIQNKSAISVIGSNSVIPKDFREKTPSTQSPPAEVRYEANMNTLQNIYAEKGRGLGNFSHTKNDANRSPGNASCDFPVSVASNTPFDSSEKKIDASVLEALGYTSHPVYTGILDPLYVDTLSMLSSTVMIQGMTDEINDNAIYAPHNTDPQQRFRYFNTPYKEPTVTSTIHKQQQLNVGDVMRQRMGIQTPVSQCNGPQNINPEVSNNNSGMFNGNSGGFNGNTGVFSNNSTTLNNSNTVLNGNRVSNNNIVMNNTGILNNNGPGVLRNTTVLNNNLGIVNDGNFFNYSHGVLNTTTTNYQNRYNQLFNNNNIEHHSSTTHHDYEFQPASGGIMFQKHPDDYKNNMQNLHFQVPRPHNINAVPEYDYEHQNMVRIDYDKSQQPQQSSSDYQSMYFVYPWSQQQAKQNSQQQQMNEASNHNSRRQQTPKKTSEVPRRKHLNPVDR